MNEERKNAIDVLGLTKDFRNGRGLFDLSLSVKEGEMIGIMGENGAGKSTLLRLLMDFVRPTRGECAIFGRDCHRESLEVKTLVAYVPGEISFPDLASGKEFLLSEMKLRNVADKGRADELVSRLQLDIRARPKHMSKGMKQKLALVCALMTKAPVLLLDEPTTGLDPLMRETLLTLLSEEKRRGRTILMTSNTFDDFERDADRVYLLSQGRILDCFDKKEQEKNVECRTYRISFVDKELYTTKKAEHASVLLGSKDEEQELKLRIPASEALHFLRENSALPLRYLYEEPSHLQDYFERRRKTK